MASYWKLLLWSYFLLVLHWLLIFNLLCGLPFISSVLECSCPSELSLFLIYSYLSHFPWEIPFFLLLPVDTQISFSILDYPLSCRHAFRANPLDLKGNKQKHKIGPVIISIPTSTCLRALSLSLFLPILINDICYWSQNLRNYCRQLSLFPWSYQGLVLVVWPPKDLLAPSYLF